MSAKKPIRHMGMTMSEEEHRKWHREHDGKSLGKDEHRKLMKHLGIGDEEDRNWHRARRSRLPEPPSAPDPAAVPVNPFAIGGGFLDYCVRQGWLMRRGAGRTTKYYVTPQGRKALAEYGIRKY